MRRSYPRTTAKGIASLPQPSDGLILEIDPRLEAHLASFPAIQTHPSCRFRLAVDVPGLRRSGSWSQLINQAQDLPEQLPLHGNLGQLERDVPPVFDADDGGVSTIQEHGEFPKTGIGWLARQDRRRVKPVKRYFLSYLDRRHARGLAGELASRGLSARPNRS